MKTFPILRGLVFGFVLLLLPNIVPAQINGPGYALSFDGVDDHGSVPASNWFSGDFTIESWVYVRSHKNWARLIDFGNAGYSSEVYLAISEGPTGFPKMGVFSNGNGPLVGSSQPIPTNQWVHLAATLSGTTGTIYLNGVNVGSGTLNIPANVLRTNNYIARSLFAGDEYADAIYDEIRIWNVAKTQSQIQANLRRSLVGNEAGLIGYWRCDEGSGTNIADATGHGNSATLFGGATWTNSTVPIASGAGGALSFNTSQYAGITHQPELNAYPLTVMTWFRATNGGGALVNKYASGSGNGYNLFIPGSGNLLGWYFRDGANNVHGGGPMNAGFVADGKWHHAAMVVDATGGRLYLDGVQKSSLPWTGTPGAPTTTQNLWFNHYPGDSLGNIQIDEASVWNTSLTLAQIQQYMTNTLVGAESGLLGYWRMDEGSGTNVLDGSGHGYAAALSGNPAWIASGAAFAVTDPAYGINLTDTNSEYVQVPSGVWFGDNFTVESWVYIRSHNFYAQLFDFGNGAGNNNISLFLSSGTAGHARLAVYNNAFASVVTANSALPLNQWVHIACTKSGSTGNIYINGVSVVSSAGLYSSTPTVVRTNNFIGRSNFGYPYANVIVDEFRIWNVARTPSQIQADRRRSLAGNEAGLVGYWRFDEGSGTNAIDATGNGNHAMLMNRPTWQLAGENLNPAATNAPIATSLPGAHVSETFAVIRGGVIPNGRPTMAWIQWGATTNYGGLTASTYVGSDYTSNMISGLANPLAPATLYHYRTVAQNDNGISFGFDHNLLMPSIAPAITNLIATNDLVNAATLKATVVPYDESATVWFAHGPTVAYGTTNLVGQIGSYGNGSVPIVVSSIASNLTAGTVHHFQVIVSNSVNVIYSPNLAFPTAAAPLVSGSSVSNLTRTSALLNASVTPNDATTLAWFQYGTTTNYGSVSSVATIGTNANPVAINRSINNLLAGTLYYYRIVATNVAGITVGADGLFTTLPPGAPTVNPPTVSGLNSNGCNLSALINPQDAATTAWFEWGTNAALGNLTTASDMGSGGTSVGLSKSVVTNVLPNLPHYFRTVASNSVAVSTSTIVSLSLTSAPLVSLSVATNIGNGNLRFTATINPQGLPTTVFFHSELFGSIAATPLTGYTSVTVTQIISLVTSPWPNFRFSYSVTASSSAGRTISPFRHFAPPLLTLFGGTAFGQCPFGASEPGYTVTSAAILDLNAAINNSMALKADGTAMIWGGNGGGQLGLNGLSGISGIAGGETFAIALRTNSTVASAGNLSPPAGLSNVVAIAARTGSALALRGDGTLVGWGATPAVPNNPGVFYQAIAAGGVHCLALTSAGNVVAWGNNSSGQTNVPPIPVPVKTIAAGYSHSMALRTDGVIHAWGDNSYGQLNIPGSIQGNVVAIATGTTFSMALLGSGQVVAWGNNSYGQTNVPPQPYVPPQPFRFVAIAAGTSHALALRNDGTIVAWGDNSSGQTNVPAYSKAFTGNFTVTGWDTSSAGTKTVTYTATEWNGDTSLALRQLFVQDFNPPIVNLLGDNPQIVPLDTSFLDPGVSATDQCSGSAISIQTNGVVNTNAIGSYTVSYIVRDPSSNATTRTRTVLVAHAPFATTVPATNVTLTSATLRATVTPNHSPTTVSFIWGTDLNYGNTNLAISGISGTNQYPATHPLSGLQPGTEYHYNVIAANALGTTVGSNLSFTTLPRPAITGIAPQSDNTCQITLSGSPGMSYTLQTSTNLSDWSNLTNLTMDANGLLDFTIDNTTNYPALFFRLGYP